MANQLNVPSDGGIAKLRWRCDGISEEVVATFAWQLDLIFGGDQSADENRNPPVAAQSWCDAWTSAFGTNSLNTGWVFVGCDISYWENGQAPATSVPPTVGSHEVNVRGTGSFRSLPINCALLVEKQTGSAGRTNRGRAYLPSGYISSNEVNPNGAISTESISAANANLETLQTNLGDNAVRIFLRLFHGQRRHGSTIIAAGAAASEVTGLTVDQRVATQRRRMHR